MNQQNGFLVVVNAAVYGEARSARHDYFCECACKDLAAFAPNPNQIVIAIVTVTTFVSAKCVIVKGLFVSMISNR